MSALVADNEVLVRYADAGRERQNLIDGGCRLHLLKIEVGGLRHGREPARKPATSLLGLGQKKEPHRCGSDRQHDTGLAVHLDLFAVNRQRYGSGGGRELGIIDGEALNRLKIEPLAVAIGKSPGDVSV